MSDTLYERRKADERSFWCPNGHHQVFADSELTKMRRERDKLRQDQARLLQERAQEMVRADKAERALKSHKKRAAAGLCPCCKRSFSNVTRHLKDKHPHFVAENVAPLKAESRA